MQIQQPTIHQKLSFIIKNQQKIPSTYHPNITQLKHHLSEQNSHPHISIAEQIRIQTFYSILQPALYSLFWEQPQQSVLYPVAAISCCQSWPIVEEQEDKDKNREKYVANLKFVTWVESGGTRCIGLKVSSSSSQKDISKFIKNSNCAIFTYEQFTHNITSTTTNPNLNSNTKIDQKQRQSEYIKFLQLFLPLAMKQQHYPVLFIGKSALYALQILSSKTMQQKKDNLVMVNSNTNILSDIFVDYDSLMFQGLDLNIRLYVQNMRKIAFPVYNMLFSEEELESIGYQVKARMLKNNNIHNHNSNKNASIIPCLIQPINTNFTNKQSQTHPTATNNNLYFILTQPYSLQNPQITQFWHCSITNFINLAKKHKRQTDQKIVDKNLIAHGKVVYRGEKGYYRI